jgi:glycosyltransferase involved in cell wall biosynthesis
MNSLLMVAFHFPPLAGSSGIQRTLRFVQHLPALGWQPVVLTADTRAYERTSDDLLSEVPANTHVHRAFALDTARHLSLGGRYAAALARPDRWISWRFDGVRQGLRLIRQHQARLIWTTYPIATAHVIGAELQRRTGLPWVADFRDPMAQDGYPEDRQTWEHFMRIEADAAARASLLCFTTPSAAQTYRQRYPAAADRIVVLENGYDEQTFERAEAGLVDRGALNPGRLTLLHSGIVYPSERDPTRLFEALGHLHRTAPDLVDRLRLRFRAAVADALLQELSQRHGVQSLVEILPPIPYAEALAEMLRADALLVMQAANCNEQVPAKIYEYMRAGRPIVTLTDPAGDTWSVLRDAGLRAVARLDDAAAIAQLLMHLASGTDLGWLPTAAATAAAARTARSAELAGHLDRLLARGAGPASPT